MSKSIANKSVANTAAILRAALLASAAIGLAVPGVALPGVAWARVGVTSATDGDPLGKPPQEAERVLRIGIDVQANEVIRTGATDRAHLVFLDGTSLTVGPNAQLTIDKFVYDPNTKIGELAVTASQGVLRLVGGKISKTNPITINTPSSTIGIRGGICLLEVLRNRTTSTFLFGHHMSVAGHAGGSQNVTRPGSQVTTNAGSPPSPPVMMSQGALSGQMGQLEGTGGGGQGGGQGSGGQGGNAPNTQNTDRTVAGNNGQPGSNNGPGQQQGQQQQQQQQANNAITNNNQSQQQNQPTTRTSQTTVVVSQNTLGRFIGDQPYVRPPNPAVTATSLGVTSNTDNDKLLASSGDMTTTTTTTTTTRGSGSTSSTSSSVSTITLTVPAGSGGPSGSMTVPWQPDTLANGFNIATMSVLGQTLTNGKGYVSKNGEFFAYLFKVNGSTVGLFGGTPTTANGGTSGFPTSGIGVYAMGSIGNGANLPFANSATVGGDTDITQAAKVGNLYAAYSTALQQTTGQAAPDARATALQAAISIAGSGSNQKSYMGVFIGTFYRDINGTTQNPTSDNGVALSGSYNGTYRTSSTGAVNQLTSAESTPLVGGANAIYGTAGKDGAASAIVLTPDSLTSVASINSGVVGNITTTRTTQASYDSGQTGTKDYYSVNAATLTTNPNNVGTNRTTQTLNGFVGGVVQQADSSGNVTANRTIATTDPTTLTLNTDATNNRASANITVANFTGSSTAEFKLGGTTGGNSAGSAFIDNNIYAVRDRTSDVGNPTTIGGSSANVTSQTVMVSYGAAPVTGYNLCSECDFLTFGWWGGNISYGSGSAFNPNGTDRLNLATYVAGTLAIASNVNSAQSTGTYRGGMIGNVVNGANSYIASGSYQNVWSFGSQSGIVTATFDGTTYGGGSTPNTYLNASSGSVNFGTLTGVGGTSAPIVSGGKSLSLNGAFFSAPGTPVAGQAGSFNITGTNYQAGGSFAAKKQ